MATESPDRTRIVRFGTFEVDLSTRELRKGGIRIKLHGQPFEVLALLLERPREVVPREELRQRLWSTDTFVDFDAGLNTAINRLREALGDSAENPRFIETVPRRGYRFIAPVEAETSKPLIADGSSSESPSEVAQKAVPTRGRIRGWRVKVLVLGLAAVVLLLAVLILTGVRERLFGRTTAPHIESLAVLPLANLSGDPEQDFFADGMTEALITDLGKISALRVISRTSVVQYKGTQKSLPEIARELNVDGLVEGTVSVWAITCGSLRICCKPLPKSTCGRKLRERPWRCTRIRKSSVTGHRARDSGETDSRGASAPGQRQTGGPESPR